MTFKEFINQCFEGVFRMGGPEHMNPFKAQNPSRLVKPKNLVIGKPKSTIVNK